MVMRRLNNVEYNNTVRDLTGIDLRPAREFPADGAAGEGFTNVSDALVMSPAMLDKYLAAAKSIAAHAVLLPDGLRFSEKTTRPDWSEEILSEIRQIYRFYTDPRGSTKVNLQGLVWDTNSGGRIPLEKYLAATIALRDAPASDKKAFAAISAQESLSPKYLQTLWTLLNHQSPSPIVERLRAHWRTARMEDVANLAGEIRQWQSALSRFGSVGHFKPWQQPVNPIAESQTFRLKLAPAPGASEVVVRLVTRDAGDGREHDFVQWREPRLESPGHSPLFLHDLQGGVCQNPPRLPTRKDAKSTAAEWPVHLFGEDPFRDAAFKASLITRAPSVLTFHLPASLVKSCEFVVSATLIDRAGGEGSVQAQVVVDQVPAEGSLIPGLTVLARKGARPRRGSKSYSMSSAASFRPPCATARSFPSMRWSRWRFIIARMSRSCA